MDQTDKERIKELEDSYDRQRDVFRDWREAKMKSITSLGAELEDEKRRRISAEKEMIRLTYVLANVTRVLGTPTDKVIGAVKSHADLQVVVEGLQARNRALINTIADMNEEGSK